MNERSALRRLLIIDDDELFCDSVRDYLNNVSLEVLAVHSIEEAHYLCLNTRFDVVLLDNSLPDGNGLELTPDILRFNDSAKIILVTAFPSLDNAVQALKTGVHGYLSKPVDLDELQLEIERALRASELEHVEQVQRYKTRKQSEDISLIGAGPSFLALQELIQKASSTNASVLITGETGTGKNIIAQSIHFSRSSRNDAFISVNCAALPENLIESELFGVEKGAFTGAIATRKGTFELADGGTLFLDEIAEMAPALQAKLLSVLEDHKVKRLGSDLVRSVDVRIIAATNANPEQAIAEGRLRSDLYYRLGVIHIRLLPLRERPQDIPLLCKHFIQKFAPARALELPDSEIERLMRYNWPGNIRELKNVIERCVILQEGRRLRPSELLATHSMTLPQTPASVADFAEEIMTLEEVERRYILSTLEKLHGNYTRTASALNISLSTLKRKLKEYGKR